MINIKIAVTKDAVYGECISNRNGKKCVFLLMSMILPDLLRISLEYSSHNHVQDPTDIPIYI